MPTVGSRGGWRGRVVVGGVGGVGGVPAPPSDLGADPSTKRPVQAYFFVLSITTSTKTNNSLLKKHEMKHRENKNASPKKHEKS